MYCVNKKRIKLCQQTHTASGVALFKVKDEEWDNTNKVD